MRLTGYILTGGLAMHVDNSLSGWETTDVLGQCIE